MTGLVKHLIWMAALSCLIPRSATSDSETCEIATKSVSATCGVAAAVTGLFGTLLCISTFGAGCAALAGVGAVAALCGVATGSASCDGDEMQQVIGLLNDIKLDLDNLSKDISLGFYVQSFEDDIEIIRNAAELYQDYVINYSKDSSGNLMDTHFSQMWVDQMEENYPIWNALMEIEDMIGGEIEGLTPKPSVYQIARKNGLCSLNLYKFVLNLLMEGTTLHFIYLGMKGIHIPDQMTVELKEQILLNHKMYYEYCRFNIPIEAFRIKISDRSYANTSGKLKIGVKQGDQNSCWTVRETFASPDRDTEYIVDDKSKFDSCKDTWFNPFDIKNPIKIQVLSDSGNDAYIDQAGVKINGQWRNWVGYQVKINKHGEGNSWRTVMPFYSF